MDGSLAGLRVGLYTRISDDTEEQARGVGRQEQDEREVVARLGGTPHEPVYEENDTSAYKKKRVPLRDRQTGEQMQGPDGSLLWAYRVVRPVYQRLLHDLRTGVIDAAMVDNLDRLARDPRDLEDAIEVVEHYRRPILGVSGSINLTTDDGRAMARVMVAMANKSSADTARRVRRKHRENAENGVPVGGTRPFGWQDDKRTLQPEEAALLREAAQRVLSGAPVHAVVSDWNARGIRTPRRRKDATENNAWTPTALRKVLTNPRLCGYSARNVPGPDGKPVLTLVTKDGRSVPGQWEPVLRPEQWEALCAVLAPRRPRPGGVVTKYLLTGIGACGACGGPLRGLPRQRKVGPTFAYQCHSTANGGCGGVSVLGPSLDDLVTEAVFRRYERHKPQAGPVSTWAGEAALERVQQHLRDLTAAWRAGDVDSGDYFALRRDLAENEKQLRADRAAVVAEQAAAAAAPHDLRERWSEYSLVERRAVIRSLLLAVVVDRTSSKTGRRSALEERVRPVWQQDR